MFRGDLTEGGGDPALPTLTLGGGWRKGGPHRRLRVVESRRVCRVTSRGQESEHVGSCVHCGRALSMGREIPGPRRDRVTDGPSRGGGPSAQLAERVVGEKRDLLSL